MNKFENKFFKLLEQDIDEALPPEEMSAEGDQAALVNSLEDPNQAAEFNPDPSMAGFQTKYVEKAKGWLTKIDEFTEWLNSTDGDSLNKQLIAMDKPNTPFEGISAEAKKITGISADLAKLAESLKGVILSVDKKQRDISRTQMGY
jgi:hypothetical protein